MEFNKETIQNLTKEFIEKMGFEADVNFYDEEGDLLIINILPVEKAYILIGREGNNLKDLQLVLKLFLEHKLNQPIRFIIDVDGYRRKRIIYFKEYAHKIVQRVRLFKKEIALPPMNSYERRIIHSELSSEPDIKTESQGVEPNRKIVVYPL